jgi:hypothetical protein
MKFQLKEDPELQARVDRFLDLIERFVALLERLEKMFDDAVVKR